MSQNGSEGLLLVRAEPLRLAQEISRTRVDVVRVADGALLLDADPAWARAINTVLVKKGARVSELRRVSRPQNAGQLRQGTPSGRRRGEVDRDPKTRTTRITARPTRSNQ